MIKKLKKHLTVVVAMLALVAPGLAAPVIGGGVASAAITSSLCDGANSAAGSTGDTSCGNGQLGTSATTSVKTLATNVVNIISLVVGIIAIIMIIFGGFRYITSGGDSGKVGNAKNTLIYAIIGLIIVALAQIIVRFVVSASSNAGQTLAS